MSHGHHTFKITPQEKATIRKLLGLPRRVPFPRCGSKSVTKAKRLGPPHTNPKHLCDECRCSHTAGFATKGDFWGLGEHVGHLGVGLCAVHDKYMYGKNVESCWNDTMKQVHAMQMSTSSALQGRSYEKYLVEEAKEAKSYNEARAGLELVADTLKKFKSLVDADGKDGEGLTEYKSSGGINELVPASDVTKMKLAVEIANSLSRLAIDQLKISSPLYIHKDQLCERMPKMLDLGRECFQLEKELLASYKPTDPDPMIEVDKRWVDGLKNIWKDVKTGRKV